MAVAAKRFRRWFRLTPDRCVVGLLAVEGLLWLPDHFRWAPKGWPVLIALATLGTVILLMLLWFAVALVFRRRFQFSIRALLLLTLAVAIPFSWLATRMKEAKEQDEMVCMIDRLGGAIVPGHLNDLDELLLGRPPSIPLLRRWLGDDFFDDIDGLSLNHTEVTDNALPRFAAWKEQLRVLDLGETLVTDAVLENLQGFNRLEALRLNETRVTGVGLVHVGDLVHLTELDLSLINIADADLARLKSLTQLRQLKLSGTLVTDAGLPEIAKLQRLQDLSLDKTKIGDAGLTCLEGLTKLDTLNLSFTKVTDTGLAHFNRLTQLQCLQLDATAVTDAGLRHLKGCKGLRELSLYNTHITGTGLLELQKALPKCRIKSSLAPQIPAGRKRRGSKSREPPTPTPLSRRDNGENGYPLDSSWSRSDAMMVAVGLNPHDYPHFFP
jgi:hypothetical protein